jgi:hypothetical protein
VSVNDWLWAIYAVGAVCVCVWTWIENNNVHYHSGPPSGCLTGLCWPLALVVGVVVWVVIQARSRLATKGGR